MSQSVEQYLRQLRSAEVTTGATPDPVADAIGPVVVRYMHTFADLIDVIRFNDPEGYLAARRFAANIVSAMPNVPSLTMADLTGLRSLEAGPDGVPLDPKEGDK
jgi:hypothetical protein